MSDLLENVTASSENLKRALALLRDTFLTREGLSPFAQIMEAALRRIETLEREAQRSERASE